MSKTFQFTNRHGRQVHVDQEQAIFLYGQPSMRFDGEVIPTTRKYRVKDERGVYKKDENGKYIYEEKKTFTLDPESTPDSTRSDYTRSGNTIELKSGITKGGQEGPASKMFKNKKSVQ